MPTYRPKTEFKKFSWTPDDRTFVQNSISGVIFNSGVIFADGVIFNGGVIFVGGVIFNSGVIFGGGGGGLTFNI